MKPRWLTNELETRVARYKAMTLYKEIVVGDPWPTDRFTVAELKEQGYVGIYTSEPNPFICS